MNHYKVNRSEAGLKISEENYDLRYMEKTESLFAQANGTFGIRASMEIPSIGGEKGFFVAGFYDAKESEVSELLNGPDILSFHVTVDGYPVNLDGCEILNFHRELNLDTAEIHTQVTLRLKIGKTMSFTSRRFASYADTRVFGHEVTVSMEEEAEIHLETGIDGKTTNGGVSYLSTPEVRVHNHKVMDFLAYSKKDQFRIFSSVHSKGTESPGFFVRRRSIFTEYDWKAKPGTSYVFQKVTMIESDENEIIEVLEKDYEELLSEHKKIYHILKEESEVIIDGIPEIEEASIALSRYHLLGMGNRDHSDVSIGAKGLTGEGYKGHIFWDTEIYLLPFYSYHESDIARNLLLYRASRREGAKVKAMEYGLMGTMYPWESADSGREETPLYSALNIHTGEVTKVWSGIKEHHVTADIIYGLWNYYHITGDESFMTDQGYEMIFDAADFWASRAYYDEEKEAYVIRDVIGPDEYTEHVNNNAFTNYLAQFVLSLAIESVHKLKEKSVKLSEHSLGNKIEMQRIRTWEAVRDGLYLPRPNEEGIIPQDDSFLLKPTLDSISFYRNHDIRQRILKDFSREEVVNMQVLKQADLVMLFNLFPERFEKKITKENIRFYEERTIHDSSLSYCAHAQASARIGSHEKAYEYFRKALEIDFNDNYKDATDGIHAAAQGGIWNSLILGFAGLEISEDRVTIKPHLSESWKSMIFTIRIRGHRIKVFISRDHVVIERNQEGPGELKFDVEGKVYLMSENRLEVERGSVVCMD